MLEFEPIEHIYRVDGKRIDSVTDIVSVYGADVDERVEEAMERAADRGTTLHSVLEMALTGEDYDGEYPAVYADYVTSIELFLASHTIEPIAIEQPIYSERLDVAGTPDLLAYIDGVLTLADWKFVSSICKPKVRAQLTGYCQVFNDNGVFPEQLLAVQFMRDKPREYLVEPGDEWDAALRIREIKRRKYQRGKIAI